MSKPETRADWGFNQPFSDAHLYRWIQKLRRRKPDAAHLTPDELASEAAKSIRAAVLAMLSDRTGLDLLNHGYDGIDWIGGHGKGLRTVFANSFESGHTRFKRGKWLDKGSAGASSDVLFLWEPGLYVPRRPGRGAPSGPPRRIKLQSELRLLDKLLRSTKRKFNDWPLMAFRALDRRQPAHASDGGRSSWIVADKGELCRVSKAPGPAISEKALSPLVSFFYATPKVTTRTRTIPMKDGSQMCRWYIIGPGRVAVVIRKTRKR
ncbi:MAG: hypothetical protein K8I27_14800 [Planctomycetes bacterium]|nr:hypothetical protein [Planctomycetota bacterium]